MSSTQLRATAAAWQPPPTNEGSTGGIGSMFTASGAFSLPPSANPADQQPRSAVDSASTSPALQPHAAPRSESNASNGGDPGGPAAATANPMPDWAEYEMDPSAYGAADPDDPFGDGDDGMGGGAAGRRPVAGGMQPPRMTMQQRYAMRPPPQMVQFEDEYDMDVGYGGGYGGPPQLQRYPSRQQHPGGYHQQQHHFMHQQQHFGGHYNPYSGGGAGGGPFPQAFPPRGGPRAQAPAFPTTIQGMMRSGVLAALLDEIHNLPPQMFEVIPLEQLNDVRIQQIEAQIAEESEKGITFDPETKQVVFIKDANGNPIDPSQQERGIHRKLPLRLTAELLPKAAPITDDHAAAASAAAAGDSEGGDGVESTAAKKQPAAVRSYASALTGGGSSGAASPPRRDVAHPPPAPASNAPSHSRDNYGRRDDTYNSRGSRGQQYQQQQHGGHGHHHDFDDSASVATSMRSKNAPSNAPLTVNGNHRFKKENTKAKKRVEAAQRSASDSFTFALLQSVSPFMTPLREKTGASLPHIKLDQRFGKRGAPETAVAQFIVAPVISGYRPTHLHELSPGDLMEFHYDFSLVLEQIGTASALCVNYGPDWKPHALPYAFLSCANYKEEVRKLCPHEVPNTKGEAVYSNDIVKDITEIVINIEELELLRTMSFSKAMRKRINLQPLYEVFESMFAPVGNYQIQIRSIHDAPSVYLIRTSADELEKQVKRHGPIIISGDEKLWEELPARGNTFTAVTNVAPPPPPAAAAAATAAPAPAVVAAAAAAAPAPADTASANKPSQTAGQQQQQKPAARATATPAVTVAAPPVAAAPPTASPAVTNDTAAAAMMRRNLMLSGACVAVTAVVVALLLRRKDH